MAFSSLFIRWLFRPHILQHLLTQDCFDFQWRAKYDLFIFCFLVFDVSLMRLGWLHKKNSAASGDARAAYSQKTFVDRKGTNSSQQIVHRQAKKKSTQLNFYIEAAVSRFVVFYGILFVRWTQIRYGRKRKRFFSIFRSKTEMCAV